MSTILNKETIESTIETNKMKYRGKKIFTNKNDYSVYLSFTSDRETQKQYFRFTVMAPDRRLSDPVRMKRSTLLTSKKGLNFLLDGEGDFTVEDILEIYDLVKENLPEIQKNPVMESERCPLSEVYTELCKYIQELDADSNCKEIFIENSLGYIRTTCFDKVVNDFSWAGYKRTELLKVLKANGLLTPSNGRVYDYYKRSDGNIMHYYRIILQPKEEEKCA